MKAIGYYTSLPINDRESLIDIELPQPIASGNDLLVKVKAVAVNPGSMLGTKMVKEGFGAAGGDIRVGADILTRAALSDEFAAATGRYFDNDSGRFASPHPDALDPRKSQEIVRVIEAVLASA